MKIYLSSSTLKNVVFTLKETILYCNLLSMNVMGTVGENEFLITRVREVEYSQVTSSI